MKKQIVTAIIAMGAIVVTHKANAQGWFVPSPGDLQTNNATKTVEINTGAGATPNAMRINAAGQVSIGSSVTPYSNFSLTLENSINIHNTSTGTYKYIYATGGTTGLDVRTDGNAIVMHDATEPASAGHIEFNGTAAPADNVAFSFACTDGTNNYTPIVVWDNGDIDLNYNVTVWGIFNNPSDMRFKKNITPLQSIKDKLFQIVPRQYNFRKDEFPKRGFDDRDHFGFIAQEVQKLYPNLVRTIDSQGHLGVSYVEFIPLLLQSLKEEDEQMQALKNTVNDLQNRLNSISQSTTGVENTINKTSGSALGQNIPNPFTSTTSIGYTIAGTCTNAFIGIYDMNGKQIAKITVQPDGKQITVPTDQLNAGMYMYSLVIDGNIVDTKKMVCSK